MTKKEWLQICKLYQTWYYIKVFEFKTEAIEYAEEHISDDMFDDGRIEFFQENFKPEILDQHNRSIEERAKAYEDNYPNMDDSFYSYYVYDGYVKGATDQQEVDIEKACTVLHNMLVDRSELTLSDNDSIIQEFRKAMEK